MASTRKAGRASWLVVLAAVGCAGCGATRARPARGPVASDVVAQLDSAAVARARVVRDSSDAAMRLKRSVNELEAGQDSAAALDFAAVRRLEPRLVEAVGGLALVAARARRFPQALALADSAIALGDTSAHIEQLRGRLFAQMGRCADAVAVLVPFLHAHPEWTQPRPELARCYLRLGRTNEAVPVMREAVRLEPEAAPLRYALVDAFTAATQLDSALAHARYLTAHQPEDGLWWAVMGRVLFLLNRVEEARTAFERAFRVQPQLLENLAPIDRNAWRALQDLPRQPPH